MAESRPAGPNLGPYILLQELGAGAIGKVRLAVHTETQQTFAIKIISKAAFQKRPELQNKIQREISLMRLFTHPHLLKLIDVLESPRHLYIVLEYASNGSLFEYIVKAGRLPHDVAARIFRQIIYGLEYLHSLGICHRDLKPENILIDANLNIKIADFGFAKLLKGSITETACGSPHYAAPEVIKGIPYDGRRADVWSCGVVLYALIFGFLPFDDKNIRTLLGKVKAGVYNMPPTDPAVAELISSILVVDPSRRITIPMMKEYRFFKLGLPDEYIVPAPLPMSSFGTPVDLSTVSPDVVDLFHKIGFHDEEIAAELSSPYHTTLKLFHHMLTSQVGFDQLDWSHAMGTGVIQREEEEFMMDPSMAFSDSLKHGSYNPASFSAATSLPSRAEWAIPDVKPMEFSPTHEIQANLDLHNTMLTIQKLMSLKLEIPWFHPYEHMIIGRREDWNRTCVVFQCMPLGEMTTGVQIQFSGQPEQAGFIYGKTEEAIAEAYMALIEAAE